MSHNLLDDLRALALPRHDWVLFGSGPLLVRGWISEAGDLDVVARGEAWDPALELGKPVLLEEWGVEVINLGKITIGTRWAIGAVDTDELIESAEVIEGIPCARISDVLTYKRIANRAKDQRHIKLIEGRCPQLSSPDQEGRR